MTRRTYTFERGPARRNIERILVLLGGKSLTEPEICQQLHMSPLNLKMYLNHLREQGKVHISSWTRRPVAGMRPFPRPLYRAGSRRNAVKPKPKTDAEVARDYRKRVMANPEEYERGYRKIRAQRARQELRLRNQRMQELAAAGFDPHTLGLVNGRVVIGNTRRTPTPDQLAEIIRLRDSGMYWKDVSAATGVPMSTARTHYLRVVG